MAGHGLQQQRQVQILGEERAGVDGEDRATSSKDCSVRDDERVDWRVSGEGRSSRLREAFAARESSTCPASGDRG